MTITLNCARGARRTAPRVLAAVAIGLGLGSAASHAGAHCWSQVTGGDEPFTRQVDQQPQDAVPQIRDALAQGDPSAHAPASRAHSYAILMDALERLGLFDDAAAASAQGLQAWTAKDGEALRLRLQLGGIRLSGQRGQLSEAAARYTEAAAQVPEDAQEHLCVLIDRGYLEQRAGLVADATRDLLLAYSQARNRGNEDARIEAGALLAKIYAQHGFNDEALKLDNEAIAYYARSADIAGYANAFFNRGNTLLAQGRLALAERDFVKARDLFATIHSPVDVDNMKQQICETIARDPSRQDAVAVCGDAYAAASAIQDREIAKLDLGALGEALLNRGDVKAALNRLNQALADDGVQLPASDWAQFHGWRGDARARLGDYLGAFQDIALCDQWLRENALGREADQIAVLRAKFDSDAQEQELRRARAEADAARATASRAALLRNLVLFAAAAGIAAILLIAWSLRRSSALLRDRQAQEDRLASIGRLTAGVAHEFNNLLTVMQQALGLLAARPSVTADADASALVREIQQSSEASANITAQLQSFARQQNLNPSSVSLGPFFTAIRPMLAAGAGAGIRLDIDADQPGPPVWADERLLASALLNLVINSRDAMPAGGALNIRARPDGDRMVRIDVIDQGTGMSAEVLRHATEPFYSTKGIGAGSGLGLSMVEGFVSQSGGRMTISSEPNRGTQVSLWLPQSESGP